MNDWHYIPFYARCYFSIFQSPYVFIKSSVVKVLLVAEIAFVVSETIFKTSFCNTKLFIISFTGCWYNCFRYNVCCWTFVIEWAFGFISTIAFMVIRSWLNNSSIMGSNDWAYISTVTSSTLSYFYFDILWCLGKWRLLSPLATNVPHHMETS